MLQIRIDVEADPWKLTQWRRRMPMLAIFALPTKTRSALVALTFDAEAGEFGDERILQRMHEGAHVAAARREVEHHIGYAPPGP